MSTIALHVRFTYLYDAHVEAGLCAELFSYVSGRLGTLIVRSLQRLQLLGSDGRPRPLVGVVQVELRWKISTK